MGAIVPISVCITFGFFLLHAQCTHTHTRCELFIFYFFVWQQIRRSAWIGLASITRIPHSKLKHLLEFEFDFNISITRGHRQLNSIRHSLKAKQNESKNKKKKSENLSHVKFSFSFFIISFVSCLMRHNANVSVRCCHYIDPFMSLKAVLKSANIT